MPKASRGMRNGEGAPFQPTRWSGQWSNCIIIYEGGRKIWRAIASIENFYLPLRSPRSHIWWGGAQNLLALQFQYIVTLANCSKESIKKSKADSLARKKYEQFGGRPGAQPGA